MLDLNLDIINSSPSWEENNTNTITKNKNVVSCHNYTNNNNNNNMNFTKVEEEEDSRTQMQEEEEDSSSSSIIITEEVNSPNNKTTTTTTTSSPLIFDILKAEHSNPNTNITNTNSGMGRIITTHQLFPESRSSSGCGDSNNLDLNLLQPGLAVSATASTTTRPKWLQLSSFESSGVGSESLELKIVQQKQQQVKKSRRGPRSKSSQYRGVTFYRRTGRWESHIWDCGKQVYLGGFDTAHAAARAYDRAAIKFRGVDADINFNLADYEDDMKQLKDLSKEEFVHILRRHSTGFARGNSKYRGVTLHKNGRWEARMGQFLGKKYMYLGLFDSEVQGARAYDHAAIKCSEREAITNFEPSIYQKELIFNASIGGSTQSLDLSLGISPPSNPRQSNRNASSVYDVPETERTMVDSIFASTSHTLYGLPMSSKSLSSLPGLVSTGLLPSYEEKNRDENRGSFFKGSNVHYKMAMANKWKHQ